MRNLRAEVAKLFADYVSDDDGAYQSAFNDKQRRALYAQAYDAERSKLIRCDPVAKTHRAKSQSRYQKKKWRRTKADAGALAAHNAQRMASYERLKADPERLARAKAQQRIYSERHAEKRKAKR